MEEESKHLKVSRQFSEIPYNNEDIKRIWGDTNGFRLFISHNSKDKVYAQKIKEKLEEINISCFVAHEDIAPSIEWPVELEKALNTLDACLCLLTEDYHKGDWPDHELGYAYGQGKMVIPVDLGKSPYGILQKIQAIKISGGLSGLVNADSFNYLMNRIIKVLLDNRETSEILKEAYVYAIENSCSYDNSFVLSKYFDYFESFNDDQVKRILKAFVENSQVRESFAFINNINNKLMQWNPNLFPDYYAIEEEKKILEREYKDKFLRFY